MGIRTSWLTVQSLEERRDGVFNYAERALKRDRVLEGRIGNAIEVAPMTRILRIADPLLASLKISHPQTPLFLAAVGEAGKPKLRGEVVRSRLWMKEAAVVRVTASS